MKGGMVKMGSGYMSGGGGRFKKRSRNGVRAV